MARKPKCSRASSCFHVTSITKIIQIDAQIKAYLINFKFNKNIRVKSESLIRINVIKTELEIIGKIFFKKESAIKSLNSFGVSNAIKAFAKKTQAKPIRKTVTEFLDSIF